MKTNNRVTTTNLTKTTSRAGRRAEKPQKTVEIEPLALDSALDVWITAKQACGILGIKGAAIYRLIDAEKPFLVSRRPLPRKIIISLQSVKALVEATRNAAFWTSPELQEEHRKKLLQIPNA